MERLLSGHSSCPGCAVALAVRFVLRAVPDDAVVVVAPSCIGPMMGPMPLSSVTVPVFHTAFETTAAAASGLARAYRARGERATVVCLAGDGGTYDIGLQALSGEFDQASSSTTASRGTRRFSQSGWLCAPLAMRTPSFTA